MIENIFIDWSGTLVDDLVPVRLATNAVLTHFGKEPWSAEEFSERFSLPIEPFYEKTLPEVPFAELEEVYHAHFPQYAQAAELLEGAREFLEYCRASGRRLFLFSTVHPEHYAAHAREFEVDHYFEEAYVAVRDKCEDLPRVLAERGLAPERTAFIGDMEHDIHAACVAGVHGWAVLTGYDRVHDLAAAQPDAIFADLKKVQRHLELYPVARPIPTVGALIENAEGKVLLVRTHKWSNRWGIPGGKVRRGELLEEALCREIREETGLEIADIQWVMVQDAIEPEEFLRPEHFHLFNYRARALSSEVALNEEAEEFAWVDRGELLDWPLNAPTRVLVEKVLAAESEECAR